MNTVNRIRTFLVTRIGTFFRRHNTKKNREKAAREILEEAVDYFDDYDEQEIDRIMQEEKEKYVNKRLIKSVKKSDQNAIQQWIGEGADVNTKDETGRTPLHIAASRGSFDIAKFLLDNGAAVNTKDERGRTPLHIASNKGPLEVAKFLLDNGADVDVQERFGLVPLHLASANGHLDVVKYLIEKGANVDVIQGGYSYNTPLHLSAGKGHLDVVKCLIENGADPNATDGAGKTPRQRAVEKGISDVADYLKEKERGRDDTEVPQEEVTEEVTTTTEAARRQEVTMESTYAPTTTEDYDNISLHIAAERGNLNAVKYFVERGADVNENNWYGGTPLKLAVENGHLHVVVYLVEKGADVNVKDASANARGWAPLHFAAYKGYSDIVKYLAEQGADVNQLDDYGSTVPLHQAATVGRVQAVEELLNKNADVHVKNRWGYTPLHSAALNGYLVIIEMLIEKGADVHATNIVGDTPLETARSRGFGQVVELLSSYQPENRERRDVSGKSWLNNGVFHWVKGLPSAAETPALLGNNSTVTAVPGINATVVNDTLMLGVVAAGLLNKTKLKQPIPENLLPPIERSLRRIDQDMIMRAIHQNEEKPWGDPDTRGMRRE